MTPDDAHDFTLLNQTYVRFRSGTDESVSYSNTVETPLVGAILSASKNASPSQLQLGQTVTYSIAIGNTGNRDASITVFDPLPDGLSFIPNSVLLNGSPLPGAAPAAGIPIGTVNVGGSVTLTFQAIAIAIPDSLVFVNQARLAYSFSTLDGRIISDAIESNSVSIAVIPYQLNAFAQLSSHVTFPGDTLYYEMALRNDGIETIDDVIIRIPLPQEFSFVPGSVVINGVLSPSIDPNQGIPVGLLPPGSAVTVKVALRLDGGASSGQVTIQGIVDYTLSGGSYSLLVNPLNVTIVDPSLAVNLSVDQTLATVGSTISYEVLVTNGSQLAVDAILTNILPNGTAFLPDSLIVDGVPRKGALPPGGIVLGTIRSNSRMVITYQAVILASADTADFQPILNQVRVNYTYRLADGRVVGQTVQSNTVKTEVMAPIITIVAQAQPMYYEMDESVRFTVTVSNTGNMAASPTVYRTPYPPGFEVTDCRINGIRTGEFTVEYGINLGLLAPGATCRITYVVFVSDTDDLELEYVATSYTCRYTYAYRDWQYSGEAVSNELILPIDYVNE